MSDREIELGAVRVFDAGVISDSKEQAVKVLEEASEVREAWADYDRSRRSRARFEESHGKCSWPDSRTELLRVFLADELADVVQAACNLAYECGVDMRAALDRCEERNRVRGRLS